MIPTEKDGFIQFSETSEADQLTCDQLRVLLDKLDAAGSTTAELAAFLRDEGVRGDRAQPYTCVIAEYLNSRLDGAYAVGAGGVITIARREGDELVRFAIAQATPVVQQFIREFDNEQHPELLREAGE